MKVSGKVVADAISKKLQRKVAKLKIKPTLAIILAGDDLASRIYVSSKIKRAEEVGVKTRFIEFSRNQFDDCLATLQKLNSEEKVHGIIMQYPIFEGWDFEDLISRVDRSKDVDGFLKDSPYKGATALGVWEMLTAFALLEGFSKTKEFLKRKKIVVLGRGKTAGGPIRELLESKGFQVTVVASDTKNPQDIIRGGDVIISATGKKNIINESNLKKGAYVVGVGVGKEVLDGKEKIYGDIKEEEVSKIAKLYCPTVGGIGPLTIVSLLENVIESAERSTK